MNLIVQIKDNINYYRSFFHSPIGTIEIRSTIDNIISLQFKDEVKAAEKSPDIIGQCKVELEEYFAGARKNFSVPFHQEGTAFQRKIWDQLQQISYGRTASYLHLATKAGKPSAVRAIGNSNSKNKLLILLPCHRVIGKKGELVGYAGELWRKKWLLNHEAKNSGAGKQLCII